MKTPWINIPLTPSKNIIFFKCPITKEKETNNGDTAKLPHYMAMLSQIVDAIEEQSQAGYKINAQYIELNAPELNKNHEGNNEIDSEHHFIPTDFDDEINESMSHIEDHSISQQAMDLQDSCQIQPIDLPSSSGANTPISGVAHYSVTPSEPDQKFGDNNEIESEHLHNPTEFVDQLNETKSSIEDLSDNQLVTQPPDPCQIQLTAPTSFAGADTSITEGRNFNKIDEHQQVKECFMTKKIPFSVHMKIDDFLHNPLCGEIAQNTFEFYDQHNQKFPVPEMDTKLLHTTTYYPEQPDYRLVYSEINEIVFVEDAQNSNKTKKNPYKVAGHPIHDTSQIKKGESNEKAYKHIRVPVVIGEYKIVIDLEDNVEFPKDVLRVKKITKEIILTNFRLIPTDFSPSNNGTRKALKGILFIEGYLLQKIEYTASQNRSIASIPPITLGQKMVVELIIHILQTQKVKIPFL